MEKTAISSTRETGAQGAQGSRGVAGRAGTAREGDGAPEQAGGFAMLLQTLATSAVGDAGAQDPTAAMPDAAALQPWMAQLQAQPLPPHGAGNVPAGDPLATLGRRGQHSLVAQTALLDGAAEAALVDGTAQGAGPAAPMGRGGVGRASVPRDAMAGAADLAPAMAVSRMAGGRHVQAGADPAMPPQAALQTAQGAAAPGMDRAAPQAVAQPLTGLEAQAHVASLTPGAAEAAVGPSAAGGGQRMGNAAQPDAAAMVVPEQPQQPGPAGASDAAQPGQLAQDGAAHAQADLLTEQVTYWVHQKTQNAAVTVDQGGQPVEVKVALTGDQAHVSLGSDRPQEREQLDAGRDQLQDMLERQGLQLAGMTVGTGGRQDAGTGQEERDPGRAGGRRASVRVEPVAPRALPPLAGRGERSLDIFV